MRVDDVGLGNSCTYVWKAVAHRHVAGGVRHSAKTIADCQQACVNDSSCVGVDFNNDHQCYLITAGLPGQGRPIIIGEDEDKKEEEETGCVHYDLKRTCGSGQFATYQLFNVLGIVTSQPLESLISLGYVLIFFLFYFHFSPYFISRPNEVLMFYCCPMISLLYPLPNLRACGAPPRQKCISCWEVKLENFTRTLVQSHKFHRGGGWCRLKQQHYQHAL